MKNSAKQNRPIRTVLKEYIERKKAKSLKQEKSYRGDFPA